jgi:hypothetical protein
MTELVVVKIDIVSKLIHYEIKLVFLIMIYVKMSFDIEQNQLEIDIVDVNLDILCD